MKNLFLVAFLLLSAIPAYAQVPTLQVKDTLGNNHLLSSLIDTQKNHLLVFWGAWSYNSKKLLEEWQPYSQSWIDQYNIEIMCISAYYDSSQIQAAKTLWHDKGWIGKLLFANTADLADIGIDAVPWTLLINTEDSTLYTHIGYTIGDVNELNDFIVANLPLGINDLTKQEVGIDVFQSGQSVRIVSKTNLKNCTVRVFALEGRQVFTCDIENPGNAFEIPKSSFLHSSGVYVITLQSETFQRSFIMYLH